jgi:hypothetical protein
MLNDKHFLFWLSYFHRIMPHVDLLYDQLQSHSANTTTAHSALGNFCNAVSTIRNEISLTSDISEEPPEFKKLKRNEDLTILAKEACDTVGFKQRNLSSLPVTFLQQNCWCLNSFLYTTKNSKELDETMLAYPMLNKERLWTELCPL